MKRIMKLIPLFLAFVLLGVSLVMFYSASSKRDKQKYERKRDMDIVFTHESSDAAYVDILIPITGEDEEYTPLNEENLQQLPFDKTIAAQETVEGLVSLSAHYDGAVTDMQIVPAGDGYKCHCDFTRKEDMDAEGASKLGRDITDKYSDMIIVVYDKAGNVLLRSDKFSVKEKHLSWMNGAVTCDMESGQVFVEKYDAVVADKHNDQLTEKMGRYFVLMVISSLVLLCYGLLGLRKWMRLRAEKQEDKLLKKSE